MVGVGLEKEPGREVVELTSLFKRLLTARFVFKA
jgi:hypothetical protein